MCIVFASLQGRRVEQIIFDLMAGKDKLTNRTTWYQPIPMVRSTMIPVNHTKDISVSGNFRISQDRDDAIAAATDQEFYSRIIPQSAEVGPRQTIFDPEIDLATIQSIAGDVARHSLTNLRCGPDARPCLGAWVVLRHKEMTLVRHRRVVDFRRVGRDDKLGFGLKIH